MAAKIKLTEHDDGSKRKSRERIKYLIFEFFMVFLAISGSFFMENMRESYVDSKKEREYVVGLLNDIKADTVDLKNILDINKAKIAGLDSLLNLLSLSPADIDVDLMYRFINTYVNSLESFATVEVTMMQMRNTGGLRLIKDKSVLDSVILYYSTYESHAEQTNYLNVFLKKIIDLELIFLDFTAFRKLNPIDLRYDSSKIHEFANMVTVYWSLLQIEVDWLECFSRQNSRVITHITKEYEL